MDKRAFFRLETLLREIKTSLLTSSKLRSLLLSETELQEASLESVKDNIYLHPIQDPGSDSYFDKKNFISVTCPSGGRELNDKENSYVIMVSVFSERSCWIYSDSGQDRIRPIIMAQHIVDALDNVQFCMSGKMIFNEMQEKKINHMVYGFNLFFTVIDGVGEPASRGVGISGD